MKRQVVIALLLAAAAGSVLWVWVVRASLPGYPDEITAPGLRGPVTVRFDARHRPFVTAGHLHDALLAQGWLHGRERLWQMELLRRAGTGSMAAGLGEDLLAADRDLWRAGVPQLAHALAGNASAALRARLDAYVAGINRALAEYAVWPPEFQLTGLEPRRWTTADVFGIGALIAFQSANNYDNELLRLALAGALDEARFSAFLPEPEQVPDFPYVLPAGTWQVLSSLDTPLLPGAALGSNGWVVSPQRAAGGRALFAFDSHDDLSLPNLFYEVHLFFAEGRALRGWSVPGLPGVINGYNEHLAWGLTNIGDTQDLFLEERHPEQPLRFRGPQGWYAARVTPVEIAVAGRDRPETLDIVHTRHGPLISDEPPLALRWTGHDLGGLGLDGFFDLQLARSEAELQDAFDRIPVPSANVTWADVDGNIGFRTIGRLPVRSAGRGLVPRPGADEDSGWRGFVDPDAMPRARNPASGYLAAANARVAPDGPLVSADNAPGYRMRRLHQMLGSTESLSVTDMQRLQLDWHNVQAALVLPGLLPVLESAGLSVADREAADILSRWARNPVNGRDMAGAVIYEQLYIALADELFRQTLPPALAERLKAHNYVLNHALDRILREADSPWWEGEREAKITRAFREALQRTRRTLGDHCADWRWDDLQSVSMRHELGDVPLVGDWLSRGPYPWGGGPATLGRARYRYHQPFVARAGATVRVVAELGPGIDVRAIISGGQSGHPTSPAYADQIPAWLAGDLEAIPGHAEDVTSRGIRLVPAGG